MPIYEYQCTNETCNHVLSVIQKINDNPPTECKQCGQQNTLKKLASLPSFHLKGGGWYKDGYAKNDDKKVEEKPTTDAKDKPAEKNNDTKGTKTETKTETKQPVAKTETKKEVKKTIQK